MISHEEIRKERTLRFVLGDEFEFKIGSRRSRTPFLRPEWICGSCSCAKCVSSDRIAEKRAESEAASPASPESRLIDPSFLLSPVLLLLRPRSVMPNEALSREAVDRLCAVHPSPAPPSRSPDRPPAHSSSLTIDVRGPITNTLYRSLSSPSSSSS